MVNDVRALCEGGKAARVLKVYNISFRYLVLCKRICVTGNILWVGLRTSFDVCVCCHSQVWLDLQDTCHDTEPSVIVTWCSTFAWPGIMVLSYLGASRWVRRFFPAEKSWVNLIGLSWSFLITYDTPLPLVHILVCSVIPGSRTFTLPCFMIGNSTASSYNSALKAFSTRVCGLQVCTTTDATAVWSGRWDIMMIW